MKLYDRINAAFNECEFEPDLLIIDTVMERELYIEGSVSKSKDIEDGVFPVTVMVIGEKMKDFKLLKDVRVV